MLALVAHQLFHLLDRRDADRFTVEYLRLLAALAALLGAELLMSQLGVLSKFDQVPPSMMLLIGPCLLLNEVLVCCSPLGRRLVQRLPLRSASRPFASGRRSSCTLATSRARSRTR